MHDTPVVQVAKGACEGVEHILDLDEVEPRTVRSSRDGVCERASVRVRECVSESACVCARVRCVHVGEVGQ